MSDTIAQTVSPPAPQPASKPAPASPQRPVKFTPPKRPPVQIGPAKVKISTGSHKGTIDDVKDLLAASDAPDHLKASLSAELDASGAKAATLDLHRHEMQGKNGRMIVIHATITPLF